MDRMVDLALCQPPSPPKPVLDHFPHNGGVFRWADVASWSRQHHAPAERRRTDRHGEQPILVVNQPLPRAEKIEVDSVRQTAGPRTDA
jgi:hypothetical protein